MKPRYAFPVSMCSALGGLAGFLIPCAILGHFTAIGIATAPSAAYVAYRLARGSLEKGVW